MTRSSLNLVWCDLEFTNVEPCDAHIMQVALLVTTPDLEPLFPSQGPRDGLRFDVRLSDEGASTTSDWVREHQADQLARSRSEQAVPVEEAAPRLAAYVLETCQVPTRETDDPRERDQLRRRNPIVAGNSVHTDLTLLRRHMPELADLLNFRTFDVTTLKELRRRWYPDVPPFDKDDEAQVRRWLPDALTLAGERHDALYDIKMSIAEWSYYRAKLLR